MTTEDERFRDLLVSAEGVCDKVVRALDWCAPAIGDEYLLEQAQELLAAASESLRDVRLALDWRRDGW
jgi:hypothetical protein